MNTADATTLLLAQVGKPYVWGANGPKSFDCSGMEFWWANATGNVRADTTAQGLYNRTVPVDTPKLGDMAFLYSGGRITHVGIMLNSDTVIEARGHAYGVVKTALSTFKKRSGYVWKGVRRDPKFALEAAPSPVTNDAGVRFRVAFGAQQNHRFGGLPSDSATRARMVKALMDVSLFGITESDPIMVRTILKEYPNHVAVSLSTGTVTIFYDHRAWHPRAHREVLYGDNYHGALCLPLERIGTEEGLDFIVNHTRPASVATPAQKIADIAKARELHGTWPVVIAGDFAMDADKVLGAFPRISDKVDTYDPAGNQYIDALYSGYGATGVDSRTLDPGNVSDHKWLNCMIQIGA